MQHFLLSYFKTLSGRTAVISNPVLHRWAKGAHINERSVSKVWAREFLPIKFPSPLKNVRIQCWCMRITLDSQFNMCLYDKSF